MSPFIAELLGTMVMILLGDPLMCRSILDILRARRR